ESQERMLLVAKKGREAEVERIFEKWDLHAVHIGHVTSDGMLRVKDRGAVVAEIPNRALTDEAPVYRRPMTEPEYLSEGQQLDLDELGSPESLALLGSAGARGFAPSPKLPRTAEALANAGQPSEGANADLLSLLGSPTIASKRWVYRQYDHMVRTNT